MTIRVIIMRIIKIQGVEMIKSSSLLVLAFLVIAVIPKHAQAGTQFTIYGSGEVYKAIDGDTFWVNLDRKKTFNELFEKSGDRDHFNKKYSSVKMRIGNIDTAESKHIDQNRNTKRGQAISSYVKQITNSKQAKFVCWDIGYYKRPICSLEVEGIGDIGAHLIKKGMTRYVTEYGNRPFFHSEYMSISY